MFLNVQAFVVEAGEAVASSFLDHLTSGLGILAMQDVFLSAGMQSHGWQKAHLRWRSAQYGITYLRIIIPIPPPHNFDHFLCIEFHM